MARIETEYAQGGFNMAVQYIHDLGPKRCRIYICTSNNDLVVRPRMTSAHLDTMIVRGMPEYRSVFPHIMKTGIEPHFVYIVDHIEWSEDRAMAARYRAPNGG